MEDFKISALNTVQLRKILSSPKLTDEQKAQFLRNNSVEIRHLVEGKISQQEFKGMMQNRPLIIFRPLKNSYTKRGDKILLANALEIEPKDVNAYIHKMSEAINLGAFPTTMSAENIEKVQAYVYRHGTKDEVVSFLDYELSNAKTTLRKLYRTLEYNSGGLADYFSRPIHRMDNKTLAKLYRTIDKRLRMANEVGVISEEALNTTSEWALYRIYEIQNNSKLKNAIKLKKALS